MIKPVSSLRRLKLMMKISKGFTLVELAVVLFLVSLVLGGVITPLATRIEQEERKKTEELLKEIKESLIGYALVNGHLPCPDCPGDAEAANCGTAPVVSNDGIEDGQDLALNPLSPRAVANDFATCVVQTGNLPWATLGLNEFDAWGNRFVYGVDQTFADNVPGTGCGTATAGISFELCSQGGASIWENAGPPANLVANNVPALVYSYGANGQAYGGTAPVSAEELENWWTDVDTDFISADYNQTAANEFDDLIIWISPATLMYKMVNAERLP